MAPPVESERHAVVERGHRTSRLESSRSASGAKEAVIAPLRSTSNGSPSFPSYFSMREGPFALIRAGNLESNKDRLFTFRRSGADPNFDIVVRAPSLTRDISTDL